MQDHSCIQRDNAFRRSKHGVDVDFADAALLDDELAEAHQEFFERGEIDGLAPAYTFQRGEHLGLLHHAAGERRVQWRQREGAVFENFHQLAAGAEEQDRPELCVDAAAQNQFVAFELQHGLHGHAEEVSLSGLLMDGGLNRSISVANGGLVAQVLAQGRFVEREVLIPAGVLGQATKGLEATLVVHGTFSPLDDRCWVLRLRRLRLL